MFIVLIYIFILRMHIYINKDLIINYLSELKQKMLITIPLYKIHKTLKTIFSMTNIRYIFQKYSDIPVLKADAIL